jgi:hypothetical protein
LLFYFQYNTMLRNTLRPAFNPDVIMATDRILANPRARDFIYEHIDEFAFDDEGYTFLSRNPSMVDFFLWQSRNIKWEDMCENPKAKNLILDHVGRWTGRVRVQRLSCMARNSDPDVLQYVIEAAETGDPFVMQYVWMYLSSNEHAFPLIDWVRHFDRINWHLMSLNQAAIPLLEAHQDKINWSNLSHNKNAIRLIEANLPRIDWDHLSTNPAAIHLLEANQHRIHWGRLARNPAAIHLIEANLDRVDWINLSGNPAAIHIIEANFDKVNWNYVASNPAIFDQTYDYGLMKKTRRDMKCELTQRVFHPRHVAHYFNEPPGKRPKS